MYASATPALWGNNGLSREARRGLDDVLANQTKCFCGLAALLYGDAQHVGRRPVAERAQFSRPTASHGDGPERPAPGAGDRDCAAERQDRCPGTHNEIG